MPLPLDEIQLFVKLKKFLEIFCFECLTIILYTPKKQVIQIN